MYNLLGTLILVFVFEYSMIICPDEVRPSWAADFDLRSRIFYGNLPRWGTTFLGYWVWFRSRIFHSNFSRWGTTFLGCWFWFRSRMYSLVISPLMYDLPGLSVSVSVLEYSLLTFPAIYDLPRLLILISVLEGSSTTCLDDVRSSRVADLGLRSWMFCGNLPRWCTIFPLCWCLFSFSNVPW